MLDADTFILVELSKLNIIMYNKSIWSCCCFTFVFSIVMAKDIRKNVKADLN